uniref:Lysozyme g n=1 Tax=Chelydra serpentina TaxID=8475 RepID=A0A8C3THN7_CHESE
MTERNNAAFSWGNTTSRICNPNCEQRPTPANWPCPFPLVLESSNPQNHPKSQKSNNPKVQTQSPKFICRVLHLPTPASLGINGEGRGKGHLTCLKTDCPVGLRSALLCSTSHPMSHSAQPSRKLLHQQFRSISRPASHSGCPTNCSAPASTKIAEKDLHTMNNYKTIIKSAGRKKCVDPAVIAAIISRETHAGTALKGGWGDHGNGFGLMQVDKRYHRLVGQWNSETHLLQGTGILVGMIEGIQKKFPRWTKEQQLKGGISAYNAGLQNVQTYDKMDIGTTGNDYANDVVARAKFYKRNGY